MQREIWSKEGVNRTERINLERQECIGRIQSWIWQRKEWEMQYWRNSVCGSKMGARCKIDASEVEEEEPTDMRRISCVREMVRVLLKLLACNVEDNWGHVEHWQRELKEVPYPEG